MRTLLVVIISIVQCLNLSAQSTDAIKLRLAEPQISESGARGSVEVRETPGADSILRVASASASSSTFMGYRVGIFFDNGQSARSKASEAKLLFMNRFPSEPVFMVYESPYYKVSAGNCYTEEEAIMLFERVRGVFPNAYVMRERLNLSDLIVDEQMLRATPVDSLPDVGDDVIIDL